MNKRWFFVVGPENSGNHAVHILFQNAEHNGKKCFGQTTGAQRASLQLLKIFALKEETRCISRIRSSRRRRDVSTLEGIIGKFDGDIVYRVSVPTGNNIYPDLLRMAKLFEDRGYEVIWVIPIRDFYCNIRSKMSSRRCEDFNDGLKNLRKEYKYIFDAVIKHGGVYWLLPMSGLFAYPKFIVAEMKILFDLEVDKDSLAKIFDADKRHKKWLVKHLDTEYMGRQ